MVAGRAAKRFLPRWASMTFAPVPGLLVAAPPAAMAGIPAVVAWRLHPDRASRPPVGRPPGRGDAMREVGPARDDAPANFRSPTP